MRKRGQVTVFIVVGILILAIVLGIFYLSKYSAKEELGVGEEGARESSQAANSVKMFVEGCLEKSAVDGIYLVFSQGGYYQFIDTTLLSFTEDEELLELPYYFYNKEEELPSLEVVEEETAKATENFLMNCLNEFEVFEKQGYIIESEDMDLTVDFKEKTQVDLVYPLVIKSGNQEASLDTFALVINFNFRDKYQVIENYLSEQEQEPDYFLVGALSSLAYENDYLFGFRQFGDDGSDVLVDFTYPDKLKKEPLIYNFALNYDWVEQPVRELLFVDSPSPLQVGGIEEWVVTEPGIATFQLEAEGEELEFSLDTDLLSIDSETGLISLDTDEFINDEYLYYMLVKDKFNNQVHGPLVINVNVNEGNLPVIESVEDKVIEVGEEFNYQVKAVNPGEEPLSFTTYSYLFDIDETSGEISFTPTEDDVGLHSVRIDVENEHGSTWEKFELDIK